MDKLELFLKGVWSNYDVRLEENKARLPNRLRGVSIFRDVTAFVTHFALLQVFEQYKRLCCEPTAIPACTGTFSKIMRLPCAHKIQERWYDRANGGVLKLENFHLHWQYIKPPAQEEDIEIPGTSSPSSAFEVILRVQEPAVVRVKGRPPGALNRARIGSEFIPPPSTSQQRRQQARSTRREPSGFELMGDLPSTAVSDSQPSARGARQRGGQRGVRIEVRSGGYDECFSCLIRWLWMFSTWILSIRKICFRFANSSRDRREKHGICTRICMFPSMFPSMFSFSGGNCWNPKLRFWGWSVTRARWSVGSAGL